MSWDDVSFVIAGKTRKAVIMKMSSHGNPTFLANALKIHVANASRALIELENEDLVDCITPNKRVGKIYALTEKGKEVVDKIKEME